MQHNEDKKPVTPADFKRSGGDTGEPNGKDPATTNNEPFEEGQLETEHADPKQQTDEEGQAPTMAKAEE